MFNQNYPNVLTNKLRPNYSNEILYFLNVIDDLYKSEFEFYISFTWKYVCLVRF